MALVLPLFRLRLRFQPVRVLTGCFDILLIQQKINNLPRHLFAVLYLQLITGPKLPHRYAFNQLSDFLFGNRTIFFLMLDYPAPTGPHKIPPQSILLIHSFAQPPGIQNRCRHRKQQYADHDLANTHFGILSFPLK